MNTKIVENENVYYTELTEMPIEEWHKEQLKRHFESMGKIMYDEIKV